MPKVLTEAQVHAFEEQGFLSPVWAMSAERALCFGSKQDTVRPPRPTDT